MTDQSDLRSQIEKLVLRWMQKNRRADNVAAFCQASVACMGAAATLLATLPEDCAAEACARIIEAFPSHIAKRHSEFRK